MSRENVDLVRRSWTADAFTALFDEHIVVDSREFPLPDVPDFYIGRDEAINAFRHYWGTWDEYAIDLVELIDAGQSVVVVVNEHGRRCRRDAKGHWGSTPRIDSRPLLT